MNPIDISRENYRQITVPIFGSPKETPEIQLIVDNLNQHFDQSDLFIELNKTNLDIYLRQVSIEQLDSITSNICSTTESHCNFIQQFKTSILKIKSYGIKGNKRLYVGFDKERKVKDRKTKEKNRGRHYYANDNKFTHHSSAVPETHLNKILLGDSENVLKDLPDNCVDLVFTSPPYNFGLDYDTQDDAESWEKYFKKLFSILDECIRMLKYGGRLIINIQPLFSDYIPSHHMISHHLMSRKMIWKGEILWEKNNYNCKFTAWGSWKNPSSPYLKYTWEFIEVFCKGSLKKEGKKDDSDITADDFKQWVYAKWSIAPERRMKEFEHPAMFPEELARRVIQMFSFQGDMVLDPFSGVGTTCLVAKKYARKYIGIDNSPKYCTVAQARLNEVI